MKLPSLLELKRLGHAALKQGLDPSALERGLQYLREGGFVSLDVATVGAKGFVIEFTLKDSTQKTKIEFTAASQPLYSSCDCSMSGYGIFCKHQAIATWVVSALASQNYDLTRVEPEVVEHLKPFEEYLLKLKSPAAAAPVMASNTSSREISEAGLSFEGIVLCFPLQSIHHETVPLNFSTTLPKAKPHQDYLLPDLAMVYHRDSDLPHPLWRSPVSFRGTTHNLFQNPHDILRRKSIFYLFSDQSRIPISEILYHKYSQLVPSELLPVSSNLNEAFLKQQTLRFFPKETNPTHPTPVWDVKAEEKLDAILLSVAHEASKLLKRGRTKVYFSTQEALEIHNQVLELSEVGFETPTHLESGYQIAALEKPDHPIFEFKTRIGLELKGAPWVWLQTLALHPDQQKLFFHPFHYWLSKYPPQMEIDSHGYLDQVLEEIQSSFHAKASDLHARPPFKFEKEETFCPHIRVFSNGTFAVELDFEDGVIDGIPLLILKQIQVLMLGLRSWDEALSEELFQVKKLAKRSNDLRLLRHIGVAALVFQETIRNLLKKDKPYDAFFEQLKQKIAQLLNKLEGSPQAQNLNLEIFCSKSAIEYLERYVLHLRSLYEERLFPIVIPGKNLWTKGVYAFYLKMIYAWISMSQAQTQGSILLKTKDGVIQNPVFEEPEKLRDLRFGAKSENNQQEFRKQSAKFVFAKKDATAEALIRAFLPLQNDGTLISLDDQSIEELNDEDFISEFILEETPDQQGRIDWFELHPKFFFKGVEISEDQAKKLTETGMITFQGKIYRLNQSTIPSLEKLSQFWDQLAQSASPKRGGKRSDRIYRLPKHYTLELLALRSTGVKVKGGPIWDQICKFYDSLGEERPPLKLPSDFKGELKSYQHRGVQWIDDLYRLGLGGILADDMGLGKTVQTLVFLEILRNRNELGHSLIVVPTSLTYNWYSEAGKFTPSLPIHIFQSKEIQKAKEFIEKNEQGLLVTTYGLLAEHEQFFNQHRWNIHIYDEAQNLKTITAKRTTVSRKMPARFKLALTGTPLENHMGEFYSLMDLVVPGSLGPFEQFRKNYMQSYSPDIEKVQFLKLKTRPLVLRRTKSAILKELPQKSESTVKIPFTDKQLAIYRDIALSWNTRVRQAITEGGESKSQLIMLTALLRLRQVCSAPSAVPNVNYTEVPPKISLLVDNLSAIIETGESALVFTQFLGTFEILEREFKKAGIPYFALHGKVSRKDRETQLQKFYEHPGGAVMLMTLKTGGVGLNLTKASYVFHLEPWWNPAVENQATDRTHRIGQTKPVQVYRYIMSESVEEKIEILKSRKSSQFNALFSDAEVEKEIDTGGLHLSQKDFEYLLGI